VDRTAAVRYYHQAAHRVAWVDEKLARVLASVQQSLGREAAIAVYAGLPTHPVHASPHQPAPARPSFDQLISLDDRPCAVALERLRARIASDHALSATWGAPGEPATVGARWRSLAGLAIPPTFADFVRSAQSLVVTRRAPGDSAVVVDLYGLERWHVCSVPVSNNAGSVRNTTILVFGAMQLSPAKRSQEREAVYVLAESLGPELQPCFLHRAQSGDYLDRKLDFPNWLDAMCKLVFD
jgi:hypothetical protein